MSVENEEDLDVVVADEDESDESEDFDFVLDVECGVLESVGDLVRVWEWSDIFGSLPLDFGSEISLLSNDSSISL